MSILILNSSKKSTSNDPTLGALINFDARQGIVHSAGSVTSWQDQASSGFALPGTTNPTYSPTGGPGGNPTVDFFMANQNRLIGDAALRAAATSMTEMTLIYVVKRPTATSEQQILWISSAGSVWGANIYISKYNEPRNAHRAGGGQLVPYTLHDNNYHVMVFRMRVSGGDMAVFQDYEALQGQVPLSSATGLVLSPTEANAKAFTIGSQNSQRYTDMGLCHLILKDKYVDDATIATYTTFLKQSWGI